MALSLVALTCAVACRFADPDQSGAPSYTPLWVYPGGTRYLAMKNASELYAVDLKSGKRLWRRQLTPEMSPFGRGYQRLICPPLFLGRSVMIREEEELLVLNGDTGTDERRSPSERESVFGSRVCPDVATDGTYVLLTDGGTLLSRHQKDGGTSWAVRLPNDASAVSAPKIDATGDVIVRTADRILIYSPVGDLESSTLLTAYAK